MERGYSWLLWHITRPGYGQEYLRSAEAMRRAGQLLASIADPGNLQLAFWKAAKGKRGKGDFRAFQEKLDVNLAVLRDALLVGQARAGDYHYFTIHDPKERTICAASFRERVLHHALMNVCEPVLERAAIFDSYACRKGKGQLAAVRRAESFARRHGWFLKMDVQKYFDSVDHSVLRDLLRRKFKDETVLALFDQVLGSYRTTPGRGLPIGNLTSQHFANFYLAPLDRFLKEHLRRRAYVRYMDDFASSTFPVESIAWDAEFPSDEVKHGQQILCRPIATSSTLGC